MTAILIKSDKKNNKMLYDMAKKIGAKVFSLKEEQFEDIALGMMMDKVKTGELVTKEVVLRKLRKK